MIQQEADELELRALLEQRRDQKLKAGNVPADFFYCGIEDFVLQHGIWYRSNRIPSGGPGVQKVCFGNAIANAILNGDPYIEGFSLTPRKEVIHHGWNAVDGELLDKTWMNTGLAYLGVEFSVGRADNAIWFDNSNVLDNSFNRKLYREPWPGENYNLVWRKSKMRRQAERRLAGILSSP